MAVRKAVAQGEFSTDSTDVVSYLEEQLKNKENLTYVVRQRLEEDFSILKETRNSYFCVTPKIIGCLSHEKY